MDFRRDSIAVAVIALSLTACVTNAQREMEQIGQQIKDLMTQNMACLAPIEANPRYARIYEKLGVATTHDPGRMPSAAQLADSWNVPLAGIAHLPNGLWRPEACPLCAAHIPLEDGNRPQGLA